MKLKFAFGIFIMLIYDMNNKLQHFVAIFLREK